MTIPNPGSDEAIWVAIPGWEDRYEVSNEGEVRSLRWEGHPGHIKTLRPCVTQGPRNKVGYRFVRLHTDNRATAQRVGRLVLMAFVRLPQAGEEQNHLNGDTLDDRLCNLEWQTRSGNQKHAVANGLASPPPNAHPLGSGVMHWWCHDDGRYEFTTCCDMGRLIGASPTPFFHMVSNEPHYLSSHGWHLSPLPPPPGSDEALRFSCLCPVLQNNHGKGYKGIEGMFIYGERCPIHKAPSWAIVESSD